MSTAQYAAVKDLLQTLLIDEVHIGDCIGADVQCHMLATTINAGIRTVGHIPDNNRKRAHLQYGETRQPKPYLVRNRDVVDETDTLIATPAGREIQGSGTWATIRYAYKQGKRTIIIYPDGRVFDHTEQAVK